MIRQGYFAKLKAYPDDELKICVSRSWPRFVRKELMTHMPSLAPSKQLLDDYRAKHITWNQYVERFIPQMDTDQASTALLELMLKSNQGEDIRLLCYEKALDNQCHRFLLLDILGEMGATVEAIK